MKSQITSRFRKRFESLHPTVRSRAVRAYKRWVQDSSHASLQFKQVHSSRPCFSVRISDDWRAVGLKEDDVIIWFWIGSHADYDNLLAQLR